MHTETVTIFYSRFTDPQRPAPQRLTSIHPIQDGPGYLVVEWTWDGSGWQQGRPAIASSMARARAAAAPAGSFPIDCPAEFALEAWGLA